LDEAKCFNSGFAFDNSFKINAIEILYFNCLNVIYKDTMKTDDGAGIISSCLCIELYIFNFESNQQLWQGYAVSKKLFNISF